MLLLMSLNISSLAEWGGEIFPVSRSTVVSHTPADTEPTGQTKDTDRSEDPGEEATPGEASPADADLEWSVEELQERIDALPEASELEGEELGDYLMEVYQETVDIRELTEGLSGDEQALLDVGKLEDLERFFAEEHPAVFAVERL